MNIYVVTQGVSNLGSALQFAFYDIDEAQKCRDRFDYGKGASSRFSTIHVLTVFDKCDDVIQDKRA